MKESSLIQWHKRYLTKTDAELTVGDIATAVRQSIELDRVLPLAVKLFKKDPLVGDQYDGEVFFALTGIGLDWWKDDVTTLAELQKFAEQILDSEDINGKIHIESWLEKIKKLEHREI